MLVVIILIVHTEQADTEGQNIVKNGLSHEIQSGRVKFEEHDSSKPQQTAADVYWVRGLL